MQGLQGSSGTSAGPVIGEDVRNLGGREQKNPGCAGWPCRPGQQLRGRSRPEKWPLARWWAPRGRPGRRIDRSGMTRRTRRRLSYLIHPLSQINSCLILRISLHLHGLVGHNTRHYSSEETCACAAPVFFSFQRSEGLSSQVIGVHTAFPPPLRITCTHCPVLLISLFFLWRTKIQFQNEIASARSEEVRFRSRCSAP